MRRAIPLVALLALSACGRSEPATNVATPAGFVPPATQKATPIAGQAQNNPITAYVGKYPGDAVGGVGFYDRTEVSAALIDAVFDAKVRGNFTKREQTSAPIFAMDGRVAAWGCEPHDCGDHNWTFLVAPDGSRGEACFHDVAMGDRSRWYIAGAQPALRPGGCPQA